MWVYIVGFLLSTLMMILATKVEKKEKVFVTLVALLIPCFIAGARDQSVGTDVTVYLEQLVAEASRAENFFDYFNSSWWNGWRERYVYEQEFLFAFLVYILIKLFNNIYIVQFVIHILIVFPLYCSLKNRENDAPLWFGMLVFYLMFYNNSLNMMRQSIAMSIGYLAIQYFRKGNAKKFMIFQIIAMLFHSSAVLNVVICIIYVFIIGNPFLRKNKRNSKVKQKRRSVVICILALSIFPFINILINLMNFIGLGRYTAYISGEVRFMPNQVIICLPIIAICMMCWKRVKKEEKDICFYLVMLFMVMVINQFTSVFVHSNRISLYFSLFYLELFSALSFKKKSETFELEITSAAVVGYMLVYWMFYYVYKGVSETVPYSIGILN